MASVPSGRRLALIGLVVLIALLFGLAERTDAAVTSVCRASQLRLDRIGGQGFTSHRQLDFALRNVSASTCHVRGYPGAAWLDGSARVLPRGVDRSPGRPVRTIALAPWHRAFFSFVYVVAGPCLPHQFTADGLQFIPPGAHGALRFYLGRTAVCAAAAGGNAQITPMRSTPSL